MGDPAAFQECVDRFGALVWSLARRYTRTQAEAEDAVQEIFLHIWKNAGRYRAEVASEATFISVIARRRLLDRRRSASREPQAADLNPEMRDESRDLESDVHNLVDAELAKQALQDLRPEQRKVIEMAIWQDLSHQEIADATGLPLGTVKTFLRRGLMQVRETMLSLVSRRGSGAMKGRVM